MLDLVREGRVLQILELAESEANQSTRLAGNKLVHYKTTPREGGQHNLLSSVVETHK